MTGSAPADWLTRLVHEHRALLARVARREGLDPEEAFDVVQDAFQAFLTLSEASRLVGDEDGSRRMLIAITRNVARNRRRRHVRARPHDGGATLDRLSSATPNPEELLVTAEEQLRLSSCLGQLAEVQRVVVSLRMLDGLAGEDVARILGLVPGHVAVLLHRAKSKLATCMAPCAGAGRTTP